MNRSLLFFLIVAPLSCVLFVLGNSQLEAQRNELLQTQARVIQNDVHERLRLYLSGTMGARLVASAFWEQVSVEQHEYEKLAGTLIEEFPEIYGVNQLDENGKIVRVFPLTKNQPALGQTTQNLKFLNDSLQANEKYWFSPPFNLFQGGRGFVCYLPLKKAGKHLGWLGIVISTDQFFDYFTNNEFGKSFNVEITDTKTGQHYLTDAKTNQPSRGDLLFQNTLTEFGREIMVTVWPKEDLAPVKATWLIPASLALLVSLLATLAFSWWNQREDARNSLANLNQLLRLTIHDTAASLTTIKGYIEIMKNDATLVPVERLSRHIGFVVDLLEQIKLVRHLSTSSEHWNTERLPLLTLVLEVSEVMSVRLRDKAILLSYAPEELAAAKVTLNRGLFAHSVLGNVLSNAIMLSPTRGTITLSHRLSEGMHEIDVCDNGPGVSPHTLKQLKDKKVSETGPSFGLMIAQQVIELHRGELQVLRGEDGKSIVRVRLPT